MILDHWGPGTDEYNVYEDDLGGGSLKMLFPKSRTALKNATNAVNN